MDQTPQQRLAGVRKMYLTGTIFPPKFYEVQEGDTFYTISRKYKIPVIRILQLNSLNGPLQKGDVLRLTK